MKIINNQGRLPAPLKTIEIMTNAESILSRAIENKNSGKLTEWENNFVSQFEGYTKKQLRRLTSKQYKALREISNK